MKREFWIYRATYRACRLALVLPLVARGWGLVLAVSGCWRGLCVVSSYLPCSVRNGRTEYAFSQNSFSYFFFCFPKSDREIEGVKTVSAGGGWSRALWCCFLRLTSRVQDDEAAKLRKSKMRDGNAALRGFETWEFGSAGV
jgi:hypothetical protein